MQELQIVVSLTNIRHNVGVFRNLCAGKKLYAVVKANAYGHGLERIGEEIECLVDGFCVATVEEGIVLRSVGVRKEILLLSPATTEEEVVLAAKHTLTLCLSSLAAYLLASRSCAKHSICVSAHVKVETGMNRLGVRGGTLTRLCHLLSADRYLTATGIYSHLYLPSSRRDSERQRVRFLAECRRAEAILGTLPKHLAATGGVLLGKDFYLDGVRIGIGLYGYYPAFVQGNLPLLPAMKIYATAVGSHRFAGGGTGYARAERKYSRLTTYRLGYADGFLRGGGAGKLQAVGKLCMDGCVAEANKKFGAKTAVMLSAAEMAAENGTIACEVLCAVGKRARIEYVLH